MRKFQMFDMMEIGWVEGSFTNQIDTDFFGSVKFRETARELHIVPEVVAYVEPGERPMKMFLVAKTETLALGFVAAGIPFLNVRVFHHGQTIFYRKVLLWNVLPPARGGIGI